MKQVDAPTTLTISLSVDDLALLQHAADVTGTSVEAFVQNSALAVADETCDSERTVSLNAEQWAAFMNALDAPPRSHARLQRLLTTPSVFD